MREKKPKQKKHGLKIEQGLQVVGNAGFRACRKRDKSVNRRAGLHDKKKYLKGERRVYKCKPLGLVHVRRIKQVVVTISAALIAVVAYFGMGFLFKPDFIYVEELGNSTVCAAKSGDTNGYKSATGVEYYMPEDGSLPTDHTVIENIAYMNYVLQNQPGWSSYMESTVSTVMEQKVYTHKKAYDGKVISADMPQGASSIARQFCVTSEDVRWREKDKNYIYDSMDNIDWPTERPLGLTLAEFRIYRGLPASEFSVYILNELTVKNFDEMSVTEKGVDENGKRLYGMTLDLRVHQSGLDSAVHYYKQQMYVTGGLYAWPEFDYTTVEYTFTEDWVVKEFTINDKYAAKMGSVSAPCTSSSTTEFFYEEEKAVNTYYPDYFNQSYIKWDPTSSSNDPTAASCLASAFGDVLTEGATLKLELTVDNKPVNGVVYLGMNGGSFGDLRVLLQGSSIGDIKVYMVDEGKNTVYIALGGNKYKVCLDDFIKSESESNPAAQSEEQTENAGFTFDTNALIEQLFSGDFTLENKGKAASLKSEIELFGLKVPVNFSFNIDKKGVASLNEVTASLKLGKNDISARMTFGTEEDIPAQLTYVEKSQYTDIKDGITLGANMQFGEITLNGNVFVGLKDGGLGEVRAKFGELAICFDPAENALYLSHSQNVKYKLNISALSGGSSGGADLSGMLSGLDLNGVISDVLGNFYMGGGTISTGLKVDMQAQLKQIISLALSIDLNNGISVSLDTSLFEKPVKVNITLGNSKVPELTNKAEYIDILNGGISADINLTLDGVKLSGVAYFQLKDGAIDSVRLTLNNGTVKVYYEKELTEGASGASKEDVIYIDLGTSKIKLPISALTGKTPKAASAGLNIGIKDIISQIIENLGGGENKITSSLELTLGEENIPLSFGVDFGKSISANANLTAFGKNITADVTLGNSQVPSLTNKADYTDVINDGFTLSGVMILGAGGKTLRLAVNSLAFKFNGGFSFELDARLIADNKYFDIYVSYTGGTITLVYGSDEGSADDKGNYVGVKINTNEDIETLKAALQDAYNRLCRVLDEIAPNSDLLTEQNLKNLISKVGAGSTSADGLSQIIGILGIELEEGEEANVAALLKRLSVPVDQNGKVDVIALIKALNIKAVGNGFAVTLGENLALNLGIGNSGINGGVSAELGNASANITLINFALAAYAPECPVSASDLLTADDLADALDYITAAFELVAEREFALNATVNITENGKPSMDVGVLVEYSQGENGFPVHINTGSVNEQTGLRENINFWIDSTAYLHLNLNIDNASAKKSDIIVDAYVLDATPATSAYLTGGNYTTDGMLDIYFSISNGGGNPMTVYLPMKDLLTVVAMGGAMLNISNIELDGENMAEINKAIKQVAAVIDQLLIQNYLGGIESQFSSIGDSIVEQILRGQKVEAKNLSELLNLLIKSVFGTEQPETPANPDAVTDSATDNKENIESPESKEIAESVPATPIIPLITCGNYVKRVEFTRNETERALSIILNSKAIYGTGYEDIRFTVNKNFYQYGVMPIAPDGEEPEEGEEVITQTVTKSYITGLSLNNIYYGEGNANKLDISATVGYEVTKPASFANFHNFSDISTLVATFVNSATHEVEPENTPATDGETITATDIAKKYELNSNYYIDGDIKLGVVVLGQNLGVTIDIHNFYVTINEDNTVEFNVSFSYNKVSIPLVFTLTESEATVDLTIKDDMIFMRKTTDSGKSYTTRIMTLADFGADIMNQLKFVLSLSDDIMKLMNGDSSGGGGLKFSDYGDYLDKFLANYSFEESNNSAVWSIDVNKGALNSLVGMNLLTEDIAVKFNAEKQQNNLLKLKSLNISSNKLFGILSLDANLNYKNPQNVWEGGSDLSGDAVKLDSGVQYGVESHSWSFLLGGTKFKDIQKHVNWAKLCRDTSGSYYLEYKGSGLSYGTLKFEYATDITNENFVEFGTRQPVLYGKNVYTLVDMPDVNEYMPAVPNGDDKLVGSWDYNFKTTAETDENGAVISMQAKYGAVTVSIISSQSVEGGINGFTDCMQDEDLGYVYYKTFKYDAETVHKLAAQSNLNTYIFRGYYDYNTGAKVNGFVADRAITLYADWVGKKINITYASDVALNGAEADKDGVYKLIGSVQYGANDGLKTPSTEVENVTFLGWFMEVGESYTYIADANALKDYFANTEISGESVNVTLWSVWVNSLEVTITATPERKSKLWGAYYEWNIKCSYSGGEFVEGVSKTIASKVGLTTTVTAYVHSTADETGADADELTKTTLTNGTKTFGYTSTSAKSRDYAGGKVEVSYSNGITFSAYKYEKAIQK